MGITYDQICSGALRRLRDHYDNMVKLQDQPGYKAMAEFDMHAWAFARTFITSTHLHGLVDIVKYAFEHGIDLEYPPEDWENWEERNDPDPKWGLEVLELLVRGYVLLAHHNGHDQTSDLCADWDAIGMLDDWGRHSNSKDALMYVDKEDYAAWGGKWIDEDSWLGYPNLLDRVVPLSAIEEALREESQRVRSTDPDPSNK